MKPNWTEIIDPLIHIVGYCKRRLDDDVNSKRMTRDYSPENEDRYLRAVSTLIAAEQMAERGVKRWVDRVAASLPDDPQRKIISIYDSPEYPSSMTCLELANDTVMEVTSGYLHKHKPKVGDYYIPEAEECDPLPDTAKVADQLIEMWSCPNCKSTNLRWKCEHSPSAFLVGYCSVCGKFNKDITVHPFFVPEGAKEPDFCIDCAGRGFHEPHCPHSTPPDGDSGVENNQRSDNPPLDGCYYKMLDTGGCPICFGTGWHDRRTNQTVNGDVERCVKCGLWCYSSRPGARREALNVPCLKCGHSLVMVVHPGQPEETGYPMCPFCDAAEALDEPQFQDTGPIIATEVPSEDAPVLTVPGLAPDEPCAADVCPKCGGQWADYAVTMQPVVVGDETWVTLCSKCGVQKDEPCSHECGCKDFPLRREFSLEHGWIKAIRRWQAEHETKCGVPKGCGASKELDEPCEWISVEDKLPEDRTYVLAYYNGAGNSWLDADGDPRFLVAKFVIGEREPNNRKVYYWDAFGPSKLFGQYVDFWMPLPPAPDNKCGTRKERE